MKQGKNVSPELLDLAGNITGIKQLSTLGDAIRGDKNLPEEDKTILLQEMENDMIEMVEVTKRLQIDSEHAITRMITTCILRGYVYLVYVSSIVRW